MKMRMLMTSLTSLVASLALAGAAHASLIAGWDFSQYLGAGALTIDGASGADTLSANYSNLDPTFSAGAESAAYGTMYINGSFGSTAVDPFGSSPQFWPTTGSLASNINAPLGPAGAVPFDSGNVLISEGQQFFNPLSMTSPFDSSVVFRATTGGASANGWGLTFGGKTFSGTSSVGVSFSTDGVSYSSPTFLALDTNDKPFSVSFGPITASTIYVRLGLTPANGQPIIDNVALNATVVPEPGTLVLLGAGLGAFALRRRRIS